MYGKNCVSGKPRVPGQTKRRQKKKKNVSRTSSLAKYIRKNQVRY
jgi:hypothetical protein